MLVPVELILSANVTTTPRTAIIEDVLPFKPLYDCTLYVRNACPVSSVIVTISMTVDLGTNVNPLFSGSYTNVLVTRTIAPGQALLHEFNLKVLNGQRIKHSVTLAAASGAGGTVISLLVGKYEDVGLVPPPQLPVSF